jgi:hypothetical protein
MASHCFGERRTGRAFPVALEFRADGQPGNGCDLVLPLFDRTPGYLA